MKTILATAAVLSLSAPAFAYTAEDSYAAYSRTAESITGDIQFDDFSITFANSEKRWSFPIWSAIPSWSTARRCRPRSTAWPCPPILNSKTATRSAAPSDVTYIGNWDAGDGLTAVAVFTGDAPPESSDGDAAPPIYIDTGVGSKKQSPARRCWDEPPGSPRSSPAQERAGDSFFLPLPANGPCKK